MSHRKWILRFCFLLSVTLCPAPLAAAELPTAEQILKIHQANQERLSGLHLQWEQVFETTEAQRGKTNCRPKGLRLFASSWRKASSSLAMWT